MDGGGGGGGGGLGIGVVGRVLCHRDQQLPISLSAPHRARRLLLVSHHPLIPKATLSLSLSIFSFYWILEEERIEDSLEMVSSLSLSLWSSRAKGSAEPSSFLHSLPLEK